MIVSLEEMKQYLRVNFDDDDEIITSVILSAEQLCKAISRIENDEEFQKQSCGKIAVMYAAAYLYEHREDADYHALTLSLRAVLSAVRKEKF
ncbi:MAG: head-tail connector protein [Ruminococcus sp.]|nr:head-tail connector protein [Ruminococcus sp.]MCM1381314.1 head-tail connector protein [Muribaculaceae bacterium]MCM1480341.1 head-tail connector protein [Muribaculaceae bacterium]